MAISFGTDTIQSFGGAAKSLFGGFGAQASAKSLRQAAGIMGENVDLARENTAVQTRQAERKGQQAIGGQQADVAAAGFSSSGSALDLLRSSTEEAAMTAALTHLQGEIDVNSYKAQQTSFLGQADAADQEAKGSFIGSAFNLVAGIASIFI